MVAGIFPVLIVFLFVNLTWGALMVTRHNGEKIFMASGRNLLDCGHMRRFRPIINFSIHSMTTTAPLAKLN